LLDGMRFYQWPNTRFALILSGSPTLTELIATCLEPSEALDGPRAEEHPSETTRGRCP